MTGKSSKFKQNKLGRAWDVFISHAHDDQAFAFRLEKSLKSAGCSVWIDHSDLRAGSLLIDELQRALDASKNVIVLWSKSASESEWVQMEWTAVVNMNLRRGSQKKGVIPCFLDDTPLPSFLYNYTGYDFRGPYESRFSELRAGLARESAPTPPPPAWEPSRLVQEILRRQTTVLGLLGERKVSEAAEQQRELNSLVEMSLRENPRDRYFLTLAGYNKKNEYMIRHWEEVQAGKTPEDTLLMDAASLFFAALSVEPDDPSALNGLGSVLILRRDLDAAEFYIRRGVERSKATGFEYPAAEHDLKLVQWMKARRKPRK